MRYDENGEQLVEHHVKYKELHGIDETVWMTKGEHEKLHTRLRKEGKCQIPVDELHEISLAAHMRTPKYKRYKEKYNKEHAEERKEYKRKCYQKKKEEIKTEKKEYYQKHTEEIKTQKRGYHQENREGRIIKMKEYYNKNKEKINAQRREHYMEKRSEKEVR